MKKILKSLIAFTLVFAMSLSVNAVSGSDTFYAGEDSEVASTYVSAGTHNYYMTLRSVSYNGLPANTFPYGAKVTMAYTGDGVRYVQRNFTSLTTYSGSYGLNKGRTLVYHIDNISNLNCYMGYSYNFG